MTAINSLTQSVDAEGRDLQARQTRLSPTSVKVSWTIPSPAYAYAGALIVASLTELNVSTFPTDSVRYQASPDMNMTSNTIGTAQVVGAFYDDLVTKEVVITNIPTNAPIFIGVHLATNVYKYFTPGVRTYAEDTKSSAWAGHINNSYGPPDNPVPGQVYYDPEQRTTFAWDGGTWLPTSAHTTISGSVDPVAYLTIDLKNYIGVGNGSMNGLTIGNPTKVEIWSITAVSPTIFQVVGSSSGVAPSLQVGTAYTNPAFSCTVMAGSTPFMVGDTFSIEVVTVTTTVGLPAGYPRIGDFFYNTQTQKLKSWSGLKWVNSESEKGEPIYQSLNIGTTSESVARDTIKDVLRRQLGYPQVCVELTEEHFDIAINNALQTFRQYSSSAYKKQHFFMQVMKNQDVYYLNDPTKQLDTVVDVLKIHRLSMVGLSNFGPDNLYAQQFLSQFYAPGSGFDLVSIYAMHSLSALYSQIFAGDVAFNWHEARRELKIYRNFNHNEKVLIECAVELKEQELLLGRFSQQPIQAWAESELFMMLGNIRGKFTSLPGPGGSLSLNADSLISQAQTMQTELLRQFKDFEVGQNGPDTFFIPIAVG